MSEARKVTVIQPTINPRTLKPAHLQLKRRTAGYARVSTENEEQATSYEAQVDYYTRYIQSNPDWEFVGIYADEGISATNTKKRDGFRQMIDDALAGKIDLIITKSVSRFARNTVDSLVTIRKLKEKGVECYFEKENIYTFDGKGELLLTIMSSLAQEESRSISENVTWGQRKRFADGKVSFAYSRFLGYDRGENKCDPPVVNRDEAPIIERIYRSFIQGMTPCGIAKELTAEGISTPSGKSKWSVSTVVSILTNEKYKGAALLQKTYTVDFLEKKTKVNEGEVPQYYVENSHEAIIPPEEWDAVQRELVRRKALGRSYSANSVFSAKLICADCGGFFGAKVWNSTSKYRRVIWQCNRKFKNDIKCKTPHLDESNIKERFVKAFGEAYGMRDEIIRNINTMIDILFDTTGDEKEKATLEERQRDISMLIQRCIEENTRIAQNQTEYRERYDRYVHDYETVSAAIDEVKARMAEKQRRRVMLDLFVKNLADAQPITEFDEQLWRSLIDKVTVQANGCLVFHFYDGTKIYG